MARRISMATRTELLDAVGARYRDGTRTERSRILDEFAAVAGYHRKHAIRLLAKSGSRKRKRPILSAPDDCRPAAMAPRSGTR